MFVEALKGAATAVTIYEKSGSIKRMVKQWADRLIRGTSRVGVFGAGGTGKTTLGKFVSGELDTDKQIEPYIESVKVAKFKVNADYSGILTVVPGQERRRPGNWNKLYEEISAGQSFRIFNVVSFGYHASGLEKIRHGAYKNEMTDDEFRSAYFEASRQEEIQALKALVPHIIAAPKGVSMMTLVTKQDLWWNDRHTVEDFYTNGEYAGLIQQIRDGRKEKGFQHEVFSCALVEQNLLMADDFRLASTTGGYDDPIRVANLSVVASAIDELLEN